MGILSFAGSEERAAWTRPATCLRIRSSSCEAGSAIRAISARVACRSAVSVKEIQGDGIHLVLINLVECAKRLAISPAATIDDLADLGIAHYHQPFRRPVRRISSSFLRGAP